MDDEHETSLSAGLLEQLTRPHNPGPNPSADGIGRQTNACEETLEIWIEVDKDDKDRVVRAGFWARACAHVVACGSAVAALAEGCAVSELKRLDADRIEQALGGLPAAERHCAVLAAEVLRLALLDYLGRRREDSWKRLYRT